MTDKWWRWKRRSEWDEFFKEFDKLERMVDEMVDESTKGFAVKKEEKKFPNPYLFGFSVSIGPDGRPQVHKFGSLQSSLGMPRVKQENEPLLDVLNCKKEIIVTAELPSVEEKDIKLNPSESNLTISVDTPGKSFYRSLSLPARVRVDSMQISYKNGVLEVRLKKVGDGLLSVKKRLLSDA